MPARVCMENGEFVVRESYAAALSTIYRADVATDEPRLVELTVLHWNNPDAPGFDSDDPAPLYSESLMTIRADRVNCVEREEPWLADIIAKCKRLQAEQA